MPKTLVFVQIRTRFKDFLEELRKRKQGGLEEIFSAGWRVKEEKNMGRRNAEAELELPPGFRFFPTDEELIVHYLCKKAGSQSLPVPIIAEVDLYKYDPWQLPEKALFGEKEWYFFTPRDRKYPNGSRPNRAAGSGYWKATGADKPITMKGGNKRVGIKKALVFYAGKAPKGNKTNWIMHEYRLADVQRPARKKGSLRLDDWVLCRIYNKKSSSEKLALEQKQSSVDIAMDSFEEIDEKNVEHILDSTEQSSGDQTGLSSFTSSDMDPSVKNFNFMRSASYPMKSNMGSQNPYFQQYTIPLNENTIKAPIQTPAFNPISSSIKPWINCNSTDLRSGLQTDSSSSKPSFSDPLSERDEVESSFKLDTFSQEEQESLFSLDLEGLQNPFPQLDQITFPDPYLDYICNLTASEYLPRFHPNDMLLL